MQKDVREIKAYHNSMCRVTMNTALRMTTVSATTDCVPCAQPNRLPSHSPQVHSLSAAVGSAEAAC